MYFGIVTFTINTVQIKSFNVPLHRAKFFKEDYIEKRDHGKSVLPRYTHCRLWVASAGVAVATEAQFSGPSANAACLADRSIQDSSIIDAPLKNIYTHTHAFRSIYGYICASCFICHQSWNWHRPSFRLRGWVEILFLAPRLSLHVNESCMCHIKSCWHKYISSMLNIKECGRFNTSCVNYHNYFDSFAFKERIRKRNNLTLCIYK